MTSIAPAERIRILKETVWTECDKTTSDCEPVDLGLGYPDFAALPEYLTEELCNAVTGKNVLLNQYTRDYGHHRLVNALSKLYSPLIGRGIHPEEEILVIGAFQALYLSISAFVNPGDEVIIIEPFYPFYEPMALLAGGIPVCIPLRPKDIKNCISSNDWVLDPDELASKFNEKTKMMIVNTPHNPFGKVFSKEELRTIAELCKQHDVVVVMDEVYEWTLIDKNEHIRMASFTDMWERTLTIGSAGKSFSVTGWRVGWIYGPRKLIHPLQLLVWNGTHSCPTPIQEALAAGIETETLRLGKPNSYWKKMSAMLENKRNKMAKFLSDVGMTQIVPHGCYYMTVDFSTLASKMSFKDEDGTKDMKFAKWLYKTKKHKS